MSLDDKIFIPSFVKISQLVKNGMEEYTHSTVLSQALFITSYLPTNAENFFEITLLSVCVCVSV